MVDVTMQHADETPRPRDGRRHRRPAGHPSRPLPQSAQRAVVAMYTGLALTVLAMLALIRYLASTDGLAQHLHEVYDGYASPPDEAGVAAYLFTLGALGILGWLWMLWAVRRQKRWAPPVATVLFLIASGVALANLTVREYGQTILPTPIGLAGLLPCIAGLVAVVVLWSRREPITTRGM